MLLASLEITPAEGVSFKVNFEALFLEPEETSIPVHSMFTCHEI